MVGNGFVYGAGRLLGYPFSHRNAWLLFLRGLWWGAHDMESVVEATVSGPQGTGWWVREVELGQGGEIGRAHV